MSDLYLILRHRLDGMTDWVMIDTDVLRQARRRLSLSQEAVARQLHVSSKTYERYEKSGRVPRSQVAALAALLELQIEAAMPEPPRITDWSKDDEVAAEIIARLERIERLLRTRPAS